MDMDIYFPGGKRVYADYGGFTIETDQPARGIDAEGSKITMRTRSDPAAGLINKIDLELELPVDFPEKYRAAVINAMNLCAVKKHLHQPPSFEITTVTG